MNHTLIIQLIAGYTLVAALVFTVIATCLSLVGIITFKDKKQQQALFAVLILELVVAAVGFFSQVLELNPSTVQNQITAEAREQQRDLQRPFYLSSHAKGIVTKDIEGKWGHCEETPPNIQIPGGFACSLTKVNTGTWRFTLDVKDYKASVTCGALCWN